MLARRRSVADVAGAHVHALDAQIRALRAQRAVCTLLARDDPSPRKAALMNDLTRLSAAERQQLIDEFVDAAFAGTDPDAPGAGIADRMRILPAELPAEPTTEQVEAWIELAELVRDPAFLARVREMAVAGSDRGAAPEGWDAAAVTEHAGPVVAAGAGPASPEAAAVLERIVPAGVDRAELADMIDTFADRRVERYWELLGTLNGWAPWPHTVPVFEWVAAALRAHPHG